ncbi:MAG TPA: endonuclease III [Candidatus Bathyarchaeia archaeon]|nr:endonuclease III [Candidatus Bathyarchaeia archaeon]
MSGRTKPFLKLDRKAATLKTMERLEKVHSDAKIALNYANPLQLLIATMLSAQTTDKTVNVVTKTLFERYKTAEDFAGADLKELETIIKSTGFYHNKAKNVKKCCQLLIEKFGGHVPRTMEQILELPGVARKTANIVLANAYGVIAGIAVDTHVRRVSKRLGLTDNVNPDKIEKDLMDIVPKANWGRITDLLIFHGRRICTAKHPKCAECVLNDFCPSAFSFD